MAQATASDLEELYRTHFRRYLRVAEGIATTPEAALDAVQDGFANALDKLTSFRGDSRLETWVWRCVVNAAYSARRPHEVSLVDEISDAPTVEESIPASTVRRLIAELPRRQRTGLFLRYYADMDYDLIGEVLGVRPGTVGAMLNQARATLKTRLEEVEELDRR